MTRPILWTDEQISAATEGQCSAPFAVSGVSIDTRSLEPGDLFVALLGEGRDGHDFVDAAFAAGASAALVGRGRIDPKKAADMQKALVEVDDVQVALESLANAARARSSAYITAITGSIPDFNTYMNYYKNIENEKDKIFNYMNFHKLKEYSKM